MTRSAKYDDICPGCNRRILEGETVIIPKTPEEADIMWHSLCYIQRKKTWKALNKSKAIEENKR